MAITVAKPLEAREVDIELRHDQFCLLGRIKAKCGLIDAIMVLRFMYPQVGLKQAKEYCQTLNDE